MRSASSHPTTALQVHTLPLQLLMLWVLPWCGNSVIAQRCMHPAGQHGHTRPAPWRRAPRQRQLQLHGVNRQRLQLARLHILVFRRNYACLLLTVRRW